MVLIDEKPTHAMNRTKGLYIISKICPQFTVVITMITKIIWATCQLHKYVTQSDAIYSKRFEEELAPASESLVLFYLQVIL